MSLGIGYSPAPTPLGGGGGGVPSGDLSGMSYQDLYSYIASRASGNNGFGGYQVAPEYQRGPGYMNQGWQDQGGSMFGGQPETRQATDTEKMFSRLGEVGESFADPFGMFGTARQNYGNLDPRTGLAFLPSLPGGIASAPFSAASKGYEAATGTNLESIDWDTGQISTQKLDSNQRAAVGADAAIDLIGTAIGGSGRAIGAGINAGRALAGKEATQVGKGFVTRVGGKAGGQVAFDVAEEGGEEFVQSYLGDIRHNQLDEGSFGRALESAAWGAAGGGLMSGGAIGVNRAIYGPSATQADNEANADPAKTALSNAPGTDIGWERQLNEVDMNGQLVQSAAEQFADDLPKTRDIAGSASTVNARVADGLDLRQADLGERVLRSVWESNAVDSQKNLAHSFALATGETDESMMSQLEDINSKQSSIERAVAYNDILKRAKGPVRFVAGRNPDTNATGVAYVNLRRVIDGDFIALNRLGFMMFGADVDGDKTQVYFGDPEVRVQGYLTRNLVSAVTGRSNLNEDYMPFLKDGKSEKRFNDLVNKAVSGNYALKGFLNNENEFVKVSDIKNKFSKAISDGDNNLAASALDELRAYVYHADRARQNNEAKARGIADFKADDRSANDKADEVVAGIMKTLDDESSALPKTLEDAYKDLEKANTEVESEMLQVYNGFGAKYFKRGDTGGGSHFAQFAIDLGYKIYANTDLGNPFFRQTGQLYHMSKAMQNSMKNGTGVDFSRISQGDMVNVFSRIMAFSFKLKDVGADVENSIEGVFRVAVQDKVRDRFAGRRISDYESFNDFMKIFQEEYNQAVKDYEAAWESDTTQGVREMFNAPKKPVLSDNATNAEKARVFREIFGHFNVETFMSISESNMMYGRSFDQVVEDNATMPGRWSGQFDNIKGMNKFWESLLKDYGSKRHAIGQRIENSIARNAKLINDLYVRNLMVNEDGKWSVQPDGYAMYAQLVDSFNLLLGPKASLHLSLATVDSFINTRWGQALMSGDQEKMLNALLSVWLTDQYGTVIDILETVDLENDPAMRNNLINELMAKQGNSTLHAMIFKSFVEEEDKGFKLKDGETGSLLKWLTSLDVSLSDKMIFYENVQVDNHGKGSLLSDACTSESDTLAIASLGNRLKRANRATDRAEKLSLENANREIENIEKLINKNDGNKAKVVNIIKNLCSQSYVNTSMDMVAGAVYSQLDVVKAMVEKGTSTNSSTSVYQSMSEINKGGIMSWLDEMGLALGNMTVNNFTINRRQILELLTNKDAVVRITDPSKDGALELTQAELFKQYKIEIKNPDEGPDEHEFWDLFKQIPQLTTIVAPQSLDIVTDGSTTTLSSNVSKPLSKAISQMIDGRLSDDSIRERLEFENQARQMMMNDPDWWGVFIASCDEGISSGSMTLSETKEACEDAMNKMVNYMMTFASLGEGQTYKEEMSLLYNNAMGGLLNQIDNTFTGMAVVSERIRTGVNVSNLDVMDLANNSINNFLDEYVLAQSMILKSLGIDIDLDWNDAVNGFKLDPDVIAAKEAHIKEHIEDYISILHATVNMFDSRTFANQQMATPTGDVARRNLLDSARDRAVAANDQNAVDAIDKILQDLDNFKNDPTLIMSNYGLTPQDLVGTGVNTDVLGESFYDMTADQAIAACEAIQRKYGIEESWSGKAETKIKKAFEKTGITDEKVKLKRFYNNLIVSKNLKSIIQGSAININTEYAMQTIDAQHKMIELAKRFRQEVVKDRLMYTGKTLVMPDFHYDNPVVSYMSSSAMMNMQSSSVATGISMDGAMTKLMGAIGALPANKFQHAFTSKSQSNKNVNGVAKVVEELVNFFQEPMHLKFKKATAPGMVAVIAGETNSQPELRKVMAFNPIAGELTSDTVERLVTMRRDELARYYNEQISNADPDGKGLGFGMDECALLAEFTTPYMEVVLNDNTKRIVNSGDMLDPAFWDGSEMEKIGISSIKPVVCSLNEISAKILRGIAQHYYDPSISDSEKTVSKINEWADAAYNDWSAYSNTKAITVKDIFNKIIARGDSFPSAVSADLTLSAIQRWDDATARVARDSFASRVDPVRVIDKDYLRSIQASQEQLRAGSKKNKNLEDSFSLVKRFTIVKSDMGKNPSGNRVFANDSHIERILAAYNGSDSQVGNQRIVSATSGDAIELFYGDNASDVSEACSNAFRRNHLFAVPAKLIGENKLKGVSRSILERSKSDIEIFNGEAFCILDPIDSLNSSYHMHTAQAYQTPMDIERITVAVGDDKFLGLPDGAHFKNEMYKFAVGYYGNQAMLLQNMVGGYSIITKPETYDEIKNLVLDGDNANVDFSYWEKNARHGNHRSIASYKEAVKNYIDNAKNKNGALPRTLSNVKHGDCVGFVKQSTDMNDTIYVPVFFEGNVPGTADTVSVSVSNGEMRLSYSCDSIDFGGPNVQKLNLFGVEFKSMGHDAQNVAKKWIAINDFGTGLIRTHNGNKIGPEYIFDLHAVKGRVFDMDDNIVCNNLFYTSRKIGGNIFYRLSEDGKTWVLKGGLNINSGEEGSLTDDILSDLTDGNREQWKRVANGEIKIFSEFIDASNVKLNETIRLLTSEMLLRNADPMLLFCPSHINHHADGTFEYMGLNAHDMPINMFTHNFTRDQVLSIFNCINRQLCPSSTKLDNNTTIFDKHGYMLATNVGTEPQRVFALVGPHYYTGEGTATGEPSRLATSSYQHMIKSLLRMGVYEPGFADLMKYMDMQAGDYRISKTTAEERLEKINFEERYTTRPRLNRNIAARVDDAINDPVILESITRYRRARSTELEENRGPLRITLSDQKTDLDKDRDAQLRCENAVSKLNDVLMFDDPRDKLSLSDVAYLTKFAIGYSDNNGRGFSSITERQFVNAVNYMIDSVKERGLLIKPEAYLGSKGDSRVRFCLLPPGMSQRLFTAKAIYSHPLHVDDSGKPNFNKFIKDQLDNMHEVIDPAIGNITNAAKKTALRHMADALYYANGDKVASGYIFGDTYWDDVESSMKQFCSAIQLSDDVQASLDRHREIGREEIEKIHKTAVDAKKMSIDTDVSGRTVLWKGDDATTGAAILRNLSATRKTIGMTYLMLRPANIIERTLTQGTMSLTMKLGQTGIGPYTFAYKTKDPMLTNKVSHDEGVIEFWAAMRAAELHGLEEELLIHVRNSSDMKAAVADFMKKQNLVEQWQSKLMNIMSGGRRGISLQIQNFLDRVIQRAPTDAAWLLTDDGSGVSFLEQRLSADPVGFIVELFNGGNASMEENPTFVLSRQCRNWAYKGDMAQQNLISAVYSEVAKRSAGIDFVTTAFVSPYFNYATNRLMRVMNFVAPMSSIHYMLVEAAQKDGVIGNLTVPGLQGLKIKDLPLAGVQVHQNLKEAITIDVMHLGIGTVALLILGMAGAVEPPEDESKWGNFKEWTYFGFRGDIPWWLEDCMGLVMPLVAFGKSCQLGKPRIDLIVNGLAYYLNNNPAVKVADAVQVLFDPFSDLYRDYDNDVEGYAKAMGGPPSFTDMVNGKTMSFGLSLVSQFITPGFVREIYNEGMRNEMEKSYKKVYEQDETGRLSPSGRTDNDTMYTTYSDAMVRKYTRNNPIMGLLADLVLKGDGDTGYLANEMPNVVIYDPAQMNSIEAFSLYNDPHTKKDPKTQEECDAIALEVVSILQGHDTDSLRQIGFMLDYDTRCYVSQYIWDQIATLNEQWYTLEQSGALDYYVAGDGDWEAGRELVSALKEDHYAQISYWKELYSEKLWSDDLTNLVAYNRRATSYAQDDEGNWYATGYRRSGFMPFTFAPSETPGEDYKFVGPHEADWQTESAVTGDWTGQRGLVRNDLGHIEPIDKPSIESWSSDGTDTGHSNIWGGNKNATVNNNGDANKNNYPNGSYGRRSGSSGGRGGSGGGRRGGGGGGSGSPSIYSRVNTPNISSPKTMNTTKNQNANFDYLRPSFQTKGSREAYRREDI